MRLWLESAGMSYHIVSALMYLYTESGGIFGYTHNERGVCAVPKVMCRPKGLVVHVG